MEKHELTVNVAGKQMIFETGRIARQAGGSILLKANDTVILATACQASQPMEDIDFLPLRIDYQEKFSAAGKTLGGFLKREGKPTEREVLTSRLIDRPLRPLFENGYYQEAQVLSYVLSYDRNSPPQPLAICAAATALLISEIPFTKAVAAVCVGLVDGRFVINPTVDEANESTLELMIAGTKDAILMIEGYSDFLTEEQILEAINEGHKAIAEICVQLEDWQKVVGKDKNFEHISVTPQELIDEITAMITSDVKTAIEINKKQDREAALTEINAKVKSHYLDVEAPKYKKSHVGIALKKVTSKIMRDMILSKNIRSDGRRLDEIRPINIETSLLPRTHGSALFTRGETQSIAVCTLGGQSMGQRYEDYEGDSTRSFYLQYSFPPFSVGEVGRNGPPGRREIGHGKLAEKALRAALPPQENFPYTIRLESNITESNGSSSMASVCGGCLAMMDAGVPIHRPIAGIAMGLILEDDKFAILSDILGVEDALGDMDFKITGDEKGVTAFQLDIKVEGITPQIMQVALMQAKEGRIHILNKMLHACPSSRKELSQYAPRIEQIKVPPSKVAIIIGPGGKQIKAIIAETGVDIDINDQGAEATVSIASNDMHAMEKAKEIIHNLIAEVEIGKTYKGKVVSIVPFGMFVQVLSKEGLCHISEIAHARVENVEDHYKEGDLVEVKVLDVNDRGQIKLSRKALIPRLEREERAPRPESDEENEAGNHPPKKAMMTPKPRAPITPPPIMKAPEK
ncbi:MAG: polyribonucleotide nucleotidyltransferase [Simkaniaceae bacterium]|nr:polyribonucleotide nucleotidyltransferase [Simkaniaceae bacterium]